MRDDLLPGFADHSIEVDRGVFIHARSAGTGSPILLLHGHPQALSTWYRVARPLAERHAVVAADMRGYGDSSRPPSEPGHAPYSKRRMAGDLLAVMRRLGHERFAVVGHDRGGRVAHRMALDFPQSVSRLAVLDIAPTLTMYALANREFATRYFWWFFLIQKFPLPETLIESNLEFFLRDHLQSQSKTVNVPEERLIQEYLRCLRIPGSVHAACEDYRASATIDLQHDAADDAAGKKLSMPLLALWGEKSTVGSLYDVLETWREKALDVQGKALDCGHLLQEESPEALLAKLQRFLAP